MEKKLHDIADSRPEGLSDGDAPLPSIISLLAKRIAASSDAEKEKSAHLESGRESGHMTSEMHQIFSALQEPVILVSKGGIPVLANQPARQLLGLDPTGRPIGKILKKLNLTAVNGVPVTYENLPIRYALAGHAIVGERFSFIDPNAIARYFSVSAYPLIMDGSITGAVVVMRDETLAVTDCLPSELARERFALKAIFESAPEAIVVVDENCRIIMSNPKARWLYEQQIPNGSVSLPDEPPPRYSDDPPNDIIALPLGRTVFNGMIIEDLEMEFKMPDGTAKHILVNTSPIRNPDGKIAGAVGIFHDITERKREKIELQRIRQELENRVTVRTRELLETVESLQTEIKERKRIENRLLRSEAALRQISKKTLETLEADRKTIAKELHDSIGASLAAIKFSIEEKLAKMVSTPPEDLTSLESIVSYLMDTIKETKRISANLRPTTMDDLGLCASISWFCREFKTFYKHVEVAQKIDIDESDLSESVKIVIYRILQEAMSNAARHGNPDKIDLKLTKNARRVLLTISDNGQGFEPATRLISKDPLSGYGILGMRERAKICGGSFTIKSRPGGGTRVEVRIPLHADNC
ncbi:MAG: PAS domain-containing protein [Thermodesulfobacteriota bacterium]